METARRPALGRPRSFDRSAALDTAMRLFWRHGYEGTSLEHLTSAMGITPPSLYAAFGNKADLYRESLRQYATLPRGFDPDALREAEDLPAAVRAQLGAVIDAVTAGDERGCMVSLGLLEAHPDRRALADELADQRRAMHDALEGALRTRLAPERARPLARYLLAVFQGLAVQAHDGVSREDLLAVVEAAALPFAAERDLHESGRPRAGRRPRKNR